MSDSVTLWTVTQQAPLSMGFSRQDCWSGLPFPSPEDLPDRGIEPASLKHLSPALPRSCLPQVPPWGKKKKEMATHSSILAWRIPGTEELVGHSSRARRESNMTEGQHHLGSPVQIKRQLLCLARGAFLTLSLAVS